MTKQKLRAARKDRSYLVATFANFPGVEIPLLSDEGKHRGSTDDTICVVAPCERRYADVPAGAQRSRTAQRQDQARGIKKPAIPFFDHLTPEERLKKLSPLIDLLVEAVMRDIREGKLGLENDT